jgi:hypothetical protein
MPIETLQGMPACTLHAAPRANRGIALEQEVERTFHDYYPREFEGNFYMQRTLGVESYGLRRIPGTMIYEYIIASPSAQAGERRYVLPFTKKPIIDEGLEDAIAHRYEGRIGESIMRITIVEFLRRHQQELGITSFDFAKGNFLPGTRNMVFAQNDAFAMEHVSRYNMTVFREEGQLERRPIAEYDGVLVYETKNKKGVLVCESKIGALFGLRGAAHDHCRQKIQERIIDPLQYLFPEHELDFLVMARRNKLVRGEHIIRQPLLDLRAYLSQAGIGLMLMPFNIPAAEMQRTAQEIVTLRRALRDTPESLPDHSYVATDGLLYLLKGRQVATILQQQPSGVWMPIFTTHASENMAV